MHGRESLLPSPIFALQVSTRFRTNYHSIVLRRSQRTRATASIAWDKDCRIRIPHILVVLAQANMKGQDHCRGWDAGGRGVSARDKLCVYNVNPQTVASEETQNTLDRVEEETFSRSKSEEDSVCSSTLRACLGIALLD